MAGEDSGSTWAPRLRTVVPVCLEPTVPALRYPSDARVGRIGSATSKHRMTDL
ncbi:exported protein of unknown function [Modestobacter italicus]|uniref:Uncharacterized protein n=1 Tax=Modestobacter italicus (strain DSM 44449 / CECT 9708 / BC 501) TaxID=2732864 RepID=I4ETM3_MODI5|nr:exported protein of unknown function [Modestobacter marinus]